MEPRVAVVEALPGVSFDALAGRVNLTRVARVANAAGFDGQVLVTTASEGLPAAVAASMTGLELVVSLGAGTEHIALPPGVRLRAMGDYLADDVADLAMALLVMANRRLVAADGFVRQGAWAAGGFPLGRGLRGRTLGLVGFGRVGQAIGRRAQAAGMRLAVHTRSAAAGQAVALIAGAPDEEVHAFAHLWAMAEQVDALVLCCPGGEGTRGLVGARELAALGAEGVLVNVARGSVVDEPALIKALIDGTIAAAGLDVFEREPAPDLRLLALPNVVLSPHIGGATVDARARAEALAVSAVLAHFKLTF